MRTLLKALLFSGLLAFAAPAFAQIHLGINFGPPPPRREIMVQAPYQGATWIPGYYIYNGRFANYVWVPGRWQAPPAPRQVWFAPRYVRRGNQYDYYEGGWRDNGNRYDNRNRQDNGNRQDNDNHNGWNKQQDRQAHGDHGR